MAETDTDIPLPPELEEKIARDPVGILRDALNFRDDDIEEQYREEVLQRAWRAAAEKESDQVWGPMSALLEGKAYREEMLETIARNLLSEHPGSILEFGGLLEGLPHEAEILQATVESAIDRAPYVLLSHSYLLEGRPYKDEAIGAAFDSLAEDSPGTISNFTDLLEGKPYEDRIVQKAVHYALENDPKDALPLMSLLKGKPYEAEVSEEIHRGLAEHYPQGIIEHPELLDGTSYKDELLETASRKLADTNPGMLLDHPDLLQGKPYGEEVLEMALWNAADSNPGKLLDHADLLKDKFYKDELLEAAFRKAATDDPQAVLDHYSLLKGRPYEMEILEEAFLNNEYAYDGNELPDRENTPRYEILEKTFRNAADNNPAAVIKSAALLKDKPYGNEVLETAFRNGAEKCPRDVLEHKRLLAGKPYKNEVLKTAYINAARQDLAFFIEHYAKPLSGKPYEKDVWQNIASAISETYGAISPIPYFNDVPEGTPAATRFAILKHFNASQEFDILTFARSEAKPSVYNGILDDMLAKLVQNKQSLTDVIKPDQKDRMGVFLEAAVSYNRINQVLTFIPQDKLPGVIRSIMDHAATSQYPSDITALSDMMVALKGNDVLRCLLEAEVKNHYDKAKSLEEKDRFGRIAAAYGKHSQEISSEMKPFFLGMAANERYKSLEKMQQDALEHPNGTADIHAPVEMASATSLNPSLVPRQASAYTQRQV